MLGLRLFFHSFNLVIKNLDQAVKLSIPIIVPWVICICYLFLVRPSQSYEPFQLGTSSDVYDALAASALFALLMGMGLVWTAVGWHRFVLLERRQGGFLPEFHLQFWPYIWRSLLLGLSLGLVFAFASAVTSTVGMALGGFWVSAALLMIVGALANWAFYLLSPILPSAALGIKMTFKEAWEYSEDYAGSIAIVALCFFVFGSILEVVTDIAIFLPKLAYFGFVSIGGWFIAMLGISILTTIYGVAVENRDL